MLPSWHTLRSAKAKLAKLTVAPTISEHKTVKDNVFYYINPAEALARAREISNPEIRRHLILYPERSDGCSHPCHSSKWHEECPSQMAQTSGQDFFLGEVCLLDCGQYVIPTAFHTRGGTLVFEGLSIYQHPNRLAAFRLTSVAGQFAQPVHTLAKCYLEVQNSLALQGCVEDIVILGRSRRIILVIGVAASELACSAFQTINLWSRSLSGCLTLIVFGPKVEQCIVYPYLLHLGNSGAHQRPRVERNGCCGPAVSTRQFRLLP